MTTRTAPRPPAPPALRSLQRATGLAAVALILAVAAFAGYYYWDRYVYLGDQSPLERSIAQLEQAVRDNPQDPDKRMDLAEFYLGKEMVEPALEQAQQVLGIYPENGRALLVAGVAQARLNRPEAAAAVLEKFTAQRQKLAQAKSDLLLETGLYFLGESYLKLNRPGQALGALETAISINPTDADALYQSGLAEQQLGLPQAALDRYHRAVRLAPDFREAYAAMIDSYTALNQPEYVAYARGMQAFSLKDYATARTHLEFAAQALPKFAPAQLGLALTYEKLGALDAALKTVQAALALAPDDFLAQQTLGRLQAAANGSH